MIKSDFKLETKTWGEKTIKWANRFVKFFKQKPLLINLPNTIGIKIEDIDRLPEDVYFRIAGGYTDYRVEKNKAKTFVGEYGGDVVIEPGDYYFNAVVYNKQEMKTIIKNMEKIEKGIDPNWSELEKALYIYMKLMNYLEPHVFSRFVPSRDGRSLRGLINRKATVCAGASLIYKEMCDRAHIECDYVEGTSKGGGHAWNVLKIDGKNYGVDLSWDSANIVAGEMKSTADNFAPSVSEFEKKHTPNSDEKVVNYSQTLSSITRERLEEMARKVNFVHTQEFPVRECKRSDGTRYLLSQVGVVLSGKKKLFKYVLSEIVNGKLQEPKLFVSDVNVLILDKVDTSKLVTEDQIENAIYSGIFSKENIVKAEKNNTHYLGTNLKVLKGGRVEFLKSTIVDEYKSQRFSFRHNVKSFERKDGSRFLVQRVDSRKDRTNDGKDIDTFEVFEYSGSPKKPVLLMNRLEGDNLLQYADEKLIANYFLSRENITRICKKSFGKLPDLEDFVSEFDMDSK